MKRRLAGTMAAVAVVATASLLFVACSSDAETRGVGEGCVAASDCTDPLVCLFQRCHSQCKSSKDCPLGQSCQGLQAKLGVCLPPDEATCALNSDCEAPLVCGRRNLCERQCANDRDCLASQTCSIGSCVDRDALLEAGTLPDGGVLGLTCSLTSDCNAGLVCKDGFCSYECGGDADCLTGETCADHVCRKGSIADAGPDAPPGYGAACSRNSDCRDRLICLDGACVFECLSSADCSQDKGCVDHVCVLGARGDAGVDGGETGTGKTCSTNFDCDDHVFCNGVERCLVGRCGAPASAPCDEPACYASTCDEASKTCSPPIKLAATDADGDGHLDTACGGDDCDDTDAKRYGGAPELCDGKDNDCDGKIDDGAIAVRGVPEVMPKYTAGTGELRQATGALLGPKWIGFGFDYGSATCTTSATVAQLIDGSGVGSPLFTIPDCTQNNSFFSATGGVNTAVLIRAHYDGSYLSTLTATLMGNDPTAGLGVVAHVVLNPGVPGGVPLVDAAWTGSDYLLGWTHADAAGPYGLYAQLSTTGVLDRHVVPTPDGGRLSRGSTVRIGWNKLRKAVSYPTAGADAIAISILGVSGTKLTEPIILTTKTGWTPLAVAGTTTGFVALYWDGNRSVSDVRGTYVSNDGVAGTEFKVPISAVRYGHGVFDGYGASFGVATDAGLYLLHARTDASDGIEIVPVYAPTAVDTTSDTFTLDATPDGKLGFFYFSYAERTERLIRAGCL